MNELVTDEMVDAISEVLAQDEHGEHAHLYARPVRLARLVAEAAAPVVAGRALSLAADDWQQGEWANAPRRADRVQERLANAQHVTNWLRARSEKEAPRG
jgi:hypothetical protein